MRKFKKTDMVSGLVVGIAFAVFVFSLEATRYNRFADAERHEAQLFAEDLKEKLEHALLEHELRARGLTTAIELSGDISQARFSLLADRFKKLDTSILNLAVVENGIVKLVHPFEQNRHLVGYNLRNDAKQWQAVARAYRTGEVTIQGPVPLLQGRLGLLLRTPVAEYGADSEHFRVSKIITVAIDASAIFQTALGLTSDSNIPESGFQVALTTAQTGGDVIGATKVFENDPTVVTLAVPGTELKLGVAPDGDWAAGYRIAWMSNLGILAVLSIVLYAAYILRQQRIERNGARRQLDAAIKTLPDGFVLYDAEDRLVNCNEKYKDMYKKNTAAMVPGARFEDILRAGLKNGQYADAVGREEEWLTERMAAHNAADSTSEQRLEDGTWLRIFERKTPDGSRVGVRVDITELKRHQEELEASNANLLQALAQRDIAEKRFSNVAALSKDWVWETDKDLRVTYMSNSILSNEVAFLLGNSRREAYKDFPKVFQSADWKWLAEKEKAHEPYRDFIYQAHGATEDNKWIRTSGDPIFDENGEFSGYRGVASDISDVYNALREAEAANAAKTEFLNVMSHELRTPLTVILGFNALLTKPDLLPSMKKLESALRCGSFSTEDVSQNLDQIKNEVSRYAKKMEVAGKHLLNLINDILDLAKIDAGKLNIDPGDVPLYPVISSVADQLSEAARLKSLELKTVSGAEIVYADELRLRQILINLVGNALKFTERGQVEIKAESRGDNIAIHVRDSGRGIPEEKLEAVFGQFDQVDPSSTREKGGTGLGLAISKQLVELQGGTMTVESEVGVGSTFTFTLPAAASHASEGAGC